MLTQVPRAQILQQNLTRLLSELRDYACQEPQCSTREASPHPEAAAIAAGMPLGHSQSSRGFRGATADGRLLSRRSLLVEPDGDAHGSPLPPFHTDDCVFTFAGPFRRPRPCGLLFRANTESRFTGMAIASPFDSGGLVRHLAPRQTSTDQEEFLREHEMPVPDYREYLAETLSLLFESPWHYVSGRGPDLPGPIKVRRTDARSWTFEVRFQQELLLEENLMAVFLPRAVALSRWALPLVTAWENEGIHVDPYVSTGGDDWTQLQRLVARYIEVLLRPERT